MLKSLLSLVLLTLCVGLAGQQDPAASPALDRQRATAGLAEAQARLAALPKDQIPGSLGGLQQQAWERRVQLLTDALALFTSAEAQNKDAAELVDRRRAYLVSQA